MADRIRSHLHIFSPQQHHFSLVDLGTRQLPVALEIPEYVCPLTVCDNRPALQSMDRSEPCISLTSEEGGTYLFDGIITDQTVYRVMNNDYLYEDAIPPNPMEKLDGVAHDIVASADIGVSQLVVSAGPVGSGHGTIAFSCPHSPVISDRISALKTLSDQKYADYSGYDYPNISQLTTSCVDDTLKHGHSQQQYMQTEDTMTGVKRVERNPPFAPQGLLWQILEHIAPIISKDDIEWPKIACFTLDSGQQAVDLLDYPGITEAYGMGDHLDIQSVEHVDCPSRSIEYQMYTEKLGDRAQAFEGTAFGNVQDAAAAFLASGIVQPAAKDLSLPFRKIMSMSQHFNPTRSDTVSSSTAFVSGANRAEKRPGASGTLHLQSLYPDDLQDQSGQTKSNVSELSFEAKTYLKAIGQLPTRKTAPASTISTKAFIKALSKPSLVTLKTHNGLITPEYVGKSGLKILNINPSTLSLLKRSLTDRRRPICTWEELKTVSDGTVQRRGADSDLPCLMNIRKQKGLPNYLLSLDSCAPTVVVIYLGPSRAYSCIMFIDMCTCTTQTPLQSFSLKPQFKTSLESLAALKALISNLSIERRTLQQAKTHALTRLILGHVPNLAIPSKQIKQSAHYMHSANICTHTQGTYGFTQKLSSQHMSKRIGAASAAIGISDLHPKAIADNDALSDILDNENIHGDSFQQLSDSASTDLPAVSHTIRDITFIHSVQICETDVKNTLQQLRLASSLDKKVEMGFYWSTQLYNDAMSLARIDLLQKEEDSGLSSIPLSYTSITYNLDSAATQREEANRLQSSPLADCHTSKNRMQSTNNDTLNNSSASTFEEVKKDKGNHPSGTETTVYCGSKTHSETKLNVMNSSLLEGGSHCEYSASPKQSRTTESNLSNTRLVDNKEAKQNNALCTHSPTVQRCTSNSISSSPKKIADADIDTSVGVNTAMLLARLHKYIDKAEAMREGLDAKINASLV